ncbi:hypothetical protein FB451DRAFT_1189800 [Mycena latifolia]|nr:hypothetical protein FB451DRAFT_1189800 [Mycena latifolia]
MRKKTYRLRRLLELLLASAPTVGIAKSVFTCGARDLQISGTKERHDAEQACQRLARSSDSGRGKDEQKILKNWRRGLIPAYVVPKPWFPANLRAGFFRFSLTPIESLFTIATSTPSPLALSMECSSLPDLASPGPLQNDAAAAGFSRAPIVSA